MMKGTASRLRFLPRDEWVQAIKNNEKDVGLVKYGNVQVKKGPTDPITGMRDIDTVISTEAVDRDRDIIYQDGWNLEAYKQNPVVLWAHDHTGPPVARSMLVDVNDANQMISRDRFTPAETYPFGHMIYRMVEGGFLSAKSVGFRPLEWTLDEERRGYELLRNELLEHSWVPVGSNPEALVQASAAGIDLSPLRQWASRILDSDPDDSRVLCWLPRHVVEAAWKQAGFVDGQQIVAVTSGADTDGNTPAAPDSGAGMDLAKLGVEVTCDVTTTTNNKTTEDDMDLEKLIEAMAALTASVDGYMKVTTELVEHLKAKAIVDESVELSDVVSGAFKEATATASGALPEGEG